MNPGPQTTGDREVPPPATPVGEEYLASMTLGERAPHDDRIWLADYAPRWASMFELTATRLRLALADRVLLIEHVGSTAVPGLSAKPVIDMILAVQDSRDESSYVPLLEAEGFVLRIREPDLHQHRFLVLRSGGQTWQLHVFSAGCQEIA